MITSWRRVAVIGSGTMLALGLGAGIAAAAIPDSGGVIHGCYKTPVPAHGTPLQVIDTDAGGSCPGGTLPLTWNQTGPQGPQGATGTTGATGPAGPAGPQATSQVVTSNTHYSIARTPATQTVQADCPSGLHAINGGVQAIVPDTPPSGYHLDDSGEAVQQFDQVDAPDFSSAQSYPQPVNSQQSWAMRVQLAGAAMDNGAVGGTDGITVTYYVICE